MEQEQAPEAAPEPTQEQDTELPEDNDGALDFFRAIGKQFKLARERAGLTQQQAADQLNYGLDQISSVERARRVPSPELLHKADALFRTGGLLSAVIEDLTKAKGRARVRHPAWFRFFARLEAETVEIHSYTTLVIPGLLQTEAYARALYEMRQPRLNEVIIEKRVSARLERQVLLTTWPRPHTTFVIEESVLHRPIGGQEVRRGQLLNLLRVADLPGSELQIMPTDHEDHAGLAGPFTLLTPKGKAQLAYTESHGDNRLISDPEEVRLMASRYGSIRAQALNFRESVTLIEKLLGEV